MKLLFVLRPTTVAGSSFGSANDKDSNEDTSHNEEHIALGIDLLLFIKPFWARSIVLSLLHGTASDVARLTYIQIMLKHILNVLRGEHIYEFMVISWK
jgi:hypothetical protein